ncbi:acyl-CoA synthetase [Paraconexibacter sp.]|uniref:acyl-CoA synthetase n=1 Tax=Paraconexibacter sp. TaxID=2949640 RepID=UPI003568E14A
MNVLGQVTQKLFTVRTLVDAGMVRPARPDRLLRTGLALAKWGPTPAAGYTASAIRYPDDAAVIDELGTLTFAEVARRSNALADSLAKRGVGEGDGVAIMCRNHRGFIDITVACSKLGANALFLNTMFARPQITDVCDREAPAAVVYDEEFADLVQDAVQDRQHFVAWTEDGSDHAVPSLEQLIAEGDDADRTPPSEKGRVVILTSGTTGTPKGANRKQPESLDPAAALFSKIPLKARERTHIAAPMFHSWGFAHFTLGMGLSSTLVLRRRFTPEGALDAVAEHGCTALIVVPVMLQRMLELPTDTIAKYDTSTLRVIGASGSALPGELGLRVMDAFGDVLYNLYGSTEVAWATIATPQDLRAAPGTAGKPPRGTIVRLYDDQGRPVAAGSTGRIFVGNEMLFEGYTGGGGKDVIDGLMSTGDVGHFDDGGRLFVDGRDDEMIVSGGENVFPREVEDLMSDHEAIDEAAVIGVPDEQFGQRLKAFAVVTDGQSVTEDELKAYIKSNLASYKVPREIVFMDELPRNATGKVLKRELKDQ